MVSNLEALFLGALQGITEWIPVSSSGHLLLAQNLLKIPESIAFDAFLHTATFLVVLAYFKKDVYKILQDTLNTIKSYLKGKIPKKTKNTNLAYLILIASIPTGFVGIAFKDVLESMYSSLFSASLGLLVTGVFLLASKIKKEPAKLDWGSAAIIGLAQGLAIVPGISRSGATISTALFLGIPKNEAARFSFLILIPAAIGGVLLESPEIISGITKDWVPYTIGFIASLLVGYITLDTLMKLIKKEKFHYFAYYVIPLGIITLMVSQYSGI